MQCQNCDGEGFTFVRNRQSAAYAPSDDCLYDPVGCQACLGSGEAMCRTCWERPAVALLPGSDREPVCAECYNDIIFPECPEHPDAELRHAGMVDGGKHHLMACNETGCNEVMRWPVGVAGRVVTEARAS